MKIIAKIVEIRGTGKCSYGHRVGDEFVIDEVGTNMCLWAFHTLFPFVTALKYGGDLPWEENKGKALVSCPDPHNTVIFELRRVED
ncbi:TIGR04076 family protein [candidate division WOR-3 bacterium]|nr:TIGR04076 family protein [candidate division WOR-3 bacterium]